MNILYGISGFGQGHVARSASVLEALLARGHRLTVMGFDASERYITAHHPDIPLFRIKVPVLHPAPTGLDFGKIANDPANQYADGIQHNYRAMQNTVDYFNGPPDIVISDYELVAAQFAYATLTPLVSIDQHSKYPGFLFPDVDGFSRIEDYSRLNLFFPFANARFATSFFKVNVPPNPDFKVTLIPPILRRELMALRSVENAANEVLVYISPFATLPQTSEEIYAALATIQEKMFHIFVPTARPTEGNLRFHVYDTEHFLQVLARAEAVISTAGHNLLSELAYVKKPVLVMPSTTFDQHLCAHVIEDNELGMRSNRITSNHLKAFFKNLSAYQRNLNAGRGLVDRFDGVNVLMAHLSEQFGV